MAGRGVLATMRPMNERSFHCVDAIAALNCTLQAAVGRFERCPGGSCPFWDDGRCLFAATKSELLASPRVAEHLLELRGVLAEVRNGESASAVRSRFYRLLNEEEEPRGV
jgi:hypothetical protein